MTQEIKRDDLTAYIRTCWVRADNMRLSREDGPWPEPSLHALVLEGVTVPVRHQRQGVFTRFLRDLVATPGYDIYIVECVLNPILRDALTRWGWTCNPRIRDYYLTAATKEKT